MSHNTIQLRALREQVSQIQDELHIVREMLACVLGSYNFSSIERPAAKLHQSGEVLIALEEAIPIVWSKSAAKSAESRKNHASILDSWAMEGLVGVILETSVINGTRFTSREAAHRFKEKTAAYKPQIVAK